MYLISFSFFFPLAILCVLSFFAIIYLYIKVSHNVFLIAVIS